MDKQSLRKIYKDKRMQLDNATLEKYNLQLATQINQHIDCNYKNILCYKVIERFNEPPIDAILKKTLQNVDNCQILYPKINGNNDTFEAVLPLNNQWELDPFGIESPTTFSVLSPLIIDLIFIPLLTFDIKGYRVGYGKGMYDKFIMQCRADVQKIGISYFEPVLTISDIHSNDIKMDMCICPDKIYTF